MAAQTPIDALAASDLVFLDALDLARQQADPTQSRLASLDVLFRLAEAAQTAAPVVVVYSTAMERPAINIPLRQTPVSCSYFTVDQLTERLGAIVLSTGLLAQLQTPEEFSFVVAHEIAHSILNSSRRSALLGQEQQRHAHAPQEELLADQLALELLGNEPRAAAAAHALILRLAQQEVARPQLEQRLAALASHGD